MQALKCFLLAMMVLSATQSYALDDKRQGFVLGVGIGVHDTELDFTTSGSNAGSESKSGLATSFKIGGGLTDQFTLYYVRNASWYSAPYIDGLITRDETYVLGISGLGVSYFLEPSGPSVYFLGALGVGDRTVLTEGESDTGTAVMIGVGYEFRDHLMLEATMLSTNIDNVRSGALDIESRSIQFTINYTIY